MSCPKIKASEVKAHYLPKRPVVAKQCKTCPFRPDRGLLKGNPMGFELVKEDVRKGMGFACHTTVYKDPTLYGVALDDNQRPQEKWLECAGAVDFKRADEVERTKELLRQNGQLIEDEQ